MHSLVISFGIFQQIAPCKGIQQWRIQGTGPGGPATPCFSTKKKIFFGYHPGPRPLSEGLDQPLPRRVLDSGLHAGFRIPGTGFQSLPVELGFWIPWPLLIFRIPKPRVPDFGFHQQKFSGFRNSDSLTWSEVKDVNQKIGSFSNRTGTSVDDGASKSNNWLDQWQSGKLSTGSRV